MSEADDAVLAELIESAKALTGAKTVTSATRLYADLGLTGDDAEMFMAAFANRFGVDMAGFTWLRFFEDESNMADMLMPALMLGASVLSPGFAVHWQRARDAEREITIAHLVEVAQRKAWQDPSEAFKRAPKPMGLTLIFSAAAILILAFFLVLGVVVISGFLAGELGEQRVLALVGVAAMSIALPAYLIYASWRQIQRKLASAENG